jgi:hypothetical protein
LTVVGRLERGSHDCYRLGELVLGLGDMLLSDRSLGELSAADDYVYLAEIVVGHQLRNGRADSPFVFVVSIAAVEDAASGAIGYEDYKLGMHVQSP